MEGPNRIGFLAIIRHSIQQIHDDFHNLAVHEMVPCNCEECRDAHRPHFFRHELLERYLRRGRYDITCEVSLEDVDVRTLLRETFPPEWYDEAEPERPGKRHGRSRGWQEDRQPILAAPPVPPTVSILFLAANPDAPVRLKIEEEARAIDKALRAAEYRVFASNTHLAVRIDDLQDLLLRHRPNILHFSGHGTETNELVFVDAQGNGVPVHGDVLHTLIRILKDNIRCVVLNGCYTAPLAAELAEVIDCVIGIGDAVTDESAIEFSTAFYRGLGYGRTVAEAFQLGQSQITLAGMDEDQLFHLHGRAVQTTRFVQE